jgi:putative zinc finger/helix-turn-helix YgiT family protein
MQLTVKPYPWKCGTCRQRAVEPAAVSYSEEHSHDGRTYRVTIPDLTVFRCGNCGTVVLGDEANVRISDAVRRAALLLPPDEIRRRREQLGLTQRGLADLLGIADATLSRWETGAQIQQRSFDRFLRLVFDVAPARDYLAAGVAQPEPAERT